MYSDLHNRMQQNLSNIDEYGPHAHTHLFDLHIATSTSRRLNNFVTYLKSAFFVFENGIPKFMECSK
jgi:hypothetical protein